MKYFVMLATQDGSFTPMMDDEEIAKFKTLMEAVWGAQNNTLGKAFGWYVYKIGTGWRSSCI